MIPASHLPVTYCSDPDVQQFIERRINDVPFSFERPWSAFEIFQQAREQFGDYRMWDAIIRVH